MHIFFVHMNESAVHIFLFQFLSEGKKNYISMLHEEVNVFKIDRKLKKLKVNINLNF